VNVAFWLQKRYFPGASEVEPGLVAAAAEACPPDERLIKPRSEAS
jgi:hypothetical protein